MKVGLSTAKKYVKSRRIGIIDIGVFRLFLVFKCSIFKGMEVAQKVPGYWD